MKRFIYLLTFLIFKTITVHSQQNLIKPFKDCGIEGSITIYDFNAKKWIASDIYDSHFPTLPASTFKIINTLIALESGVIGNENELIKWPGTTDTIKYGYRPGIYYNMTMKDAFKASAGWAYVELSKQIGKEKYIKYLTECEYGNVNISTNDADFWNFGGFAISPVNQIEILKYALKAGLDNKCMEVIIMEKAQKNLQSIIQYLNLQEKKLFRNLLKKDGLVREIRRRLNVYA